MAKDGSIKYYYYYKASILVWSEMFTPRQSSNCVELGAQYRRYLAACCPTSSGQYDNLFCTKVQKVNKTF